MWEFQLEKLSKEISRGEGCHTVPLKIQRGDTIAPFFEVEYKYEGLLEIRRYSNFQIW